MTTEHGNFQRRGTITSQVTVTDAITTGLPQEKSTTSFAASSIGTRSANDFPSGNMGLHSDSITTTGVINTSYPVSYFDPRLGTVADITSDKTPSQPNPNSVIPGGAGNSLPTPTGGGGGGTTKYFQMVGYYTTGAVYEAFVVTGSPAPSTTTNPNTGHTLVNTYVASFWQV